MICRAREPGDSASRPLPTAARAIIQGRSLTGRRPMPVNASSPRMAIMPKAKQVRKADGQSIPRALASWAL